MAEKTKITAESPDRTRLREIFNKGATVQKDGSKYMSFDDFLKNLVPSQNQLRPDTLKYLWQLADTNGSGLLDFEEYYIFESLMAAPDADYRICFSIFDKNGKGYVTRDDFKQTISNMARNNPIGTFNFGAEWVDRYFGKTGDIKLPYADFTQVLKGLGTERWRQAFTAADKERKGHINGAQFMQIVSSVNDGKLPTKLKEELATLAGFNDSTKKISYSQYIAFYYILRDLTHYDHLIKHITRDGSQPNRDEFMRLARAGSFEVTPLEIDLIFNMFADKGSGRLDRTNYTKVVGNQMDVVHYRKIQWNQVQHGPAPPAHVGKSASEYAIESVINFGLGAVAGAIGAFAVYPIDLVKTRMQNQRVTEASQRLYKNSFDCFGKVISNEGILGLYKGLLPQLVGVAPEKAIKLTVNDFLRSVFRNEQKGDIYFPLEVLAGGGAGMSQVLFTNPLEIVKIRLQTQGEALRLHGIPPKGAMTIVRELGFFGLYKGAGACLLRDIPFSGIYFPTYAAAKQRFADSRADKKPEKTDLLLAGAIAGVPAASLVTPADVIKTRLQVEARKGQQTYSGIRDCFWKVLKAEGPFAFGKGALARVFRSSPQFGVTLFSYEMLHSYLAPHLGGLRNRPPEAVVSEKDIQGFMHQRNVQKIAELETKWGIGGKN